MILHDRRAPRLRRPHHLRPPAQYEPAPARKANKLGAKRRRQLLDFIRRRGEATLAELSDRFGRHVAVSTLATLWEMRLIDCLDHDRFALRKEAP